MKVSEWDIFIDDVEGELAMDKSEEIGGRFIEVIAKEEVIEDLEWMLKELHSTFSEFDGPDYIAGLQKVNGLMDKYDVRLL